MAAAACSTVDANPAVLAPAAKAAVLSTVALLAMRREDVETATLEVASQALHVLGPWWPSSTDALQEAMVQVGELGRWTGLEPCQQPFAPARAPAASEQSGPLTGQYLQSHRIEVASDLEALRRQVTAVVPERRLAREVRQVGKHWKNQQATEVQKQKHEHQRLAAGTEVVCKIVPP